MCAMGPTRSLAVATVTDIGTMIKTKIQAFSTNVRDYPEGMSSYERDSLAADAVPAARRKAKKKSPLKTKVM